MTKFGLPIAALSLLGTLAVAAPARADEHPSGDTRTRIEAALQDRGFESWGEIERSDDGRAWKVDDARLRNGGKYELRLSTDDLHEISRHVDD